MTEIRVEPGQLTDASRAVHRSVVEVLDYKRSGPAVLANQVAGDVSLAEATQLFSRHWDANVDHLEETARGIIHFLNEAAAAYTATDAAVAGVPGAST